MLKDVQDAEKNCTNAPEQAEYMPYSCTVLTKALVEYAAKYLNETDETKERCLREMKEHLIKDCGFNITSADDIFILCYLRSRKFDCQRTKALFKKGLEFVYSNRSLFDRVDSQAVRRATESKAAGFLPYRDSKGRALFLIRAENWDPDTLKADEVIFGSIVTLHTAAENPVNQVAGFVVILDFKNLMMKHIISISSWLIFGIQALQSCCPCLVKEIHIVHTPAVFRGVWKVIKPLVGDKIRKRINFYKSTHWDSLHRKIPPEILPEELGGHLGPFSNDHWASDLAAIENRYNKKIQRFLGKNDKPPSDQGSR